MKRSIKIENICQVVGADGRPVLLCYMSDGSQWLCDKDGTNWKKDIDSCLELTGKFNQREV